MFNHNNNNRYYSSSLNQSLIPNPIKIKEVVVFFHLENFISIHKKSYKGEVYLDCPLTKTKGK